MQRPLQYFLQCSDWKQFASNAPPLLYALMASGIFPLNFYFLDLTNFLQQKQCHLGSWMNAVSCVTSTCVFGVLFPIQTVSISIYQRIPNQLNLNKDCLSYSKPSCRAHLHLRPSRPNSLGDLNQMGGPSLADVFLVHLHSALQALTPSFLSIAPSMP